ncbi:MAG: DNA mismatch endonuclease Vsr [Mesorhizobium sp.]|nr:MAG: DNA mismatch endonuclease Vsr [Mesorhizobium sp.]
MADIFSKSDRSRLMGRVRNKNTAPEIIVRCALHAAGLRFRVHRKDLPGSPDVVLPGLGTVVFVHGCFWHGHDCRRGRRPQDNRMFWDAKVDRNIARDKEARVALATAGWTVETLWQCQLKTELPLLVARLTLLRDDLRLTR